MADPRVTQVIREFEQFTGSQTRALALLIANNVVSSNPFLTGWSASRWRLSLGTPSEGVVKKPPLSRIAQGVASSRIGQANSFAKIARLRRQKQEPINLTNDAAYINELNTKRYPQFVERARDRAIAHAKSVKRL